MVHFYISYIVNIIKLPKQKADNESVNLTKTNSRRLKINLFIRITYVFEFYKFLETGIVNRLDDSYFTRRYTSVVLITSNYAIAHFVSITTVNKFPDTSRISAQ